MLGNSGKEKGMQLQHMFIIILLFIGTTITSCAQSNLVVTIKNIKTTAGSVRVAVFDNEADFLKKAFQGKTVKATDNEVSVLFENLPPGEYALSVFHDENENGELDKNFIGIPKEGFAFGNNAMGAFGPPSFEKAKVNLQGEPVTQEITLKFM